MEGLSSQLEVLVCPCSRGVWGLKGGVTKLTRLQDSCVMTAPGKQGQGGSDGERQAGSQCSGSDPERGAGRHRTNRPVGARNMGAGESDPRSLTGQSGALDRDRDPKVPVRFGRRTRCSGL